MGISMFKLRATILKDIRILLRDKVGLCFMFGMPILLVLVLTAIQSSTFELVNKNKLPLLLCNRDTGRLSEEFIQAIDKIGMFRLVDIPKEDSEKKILSRMHAKNARLAIVIPEDFSFNIKSQAKKVAGKAMRSFGLEGDSVKVISENSVNPMTLYYHPVLQESFRLTARGALNSALQLVESKQVLRNLYFSINEKELPDSLEKDMLTNRLDINEISAAMDGTKRMPNASQHNVPAWTIFAMFFIVISLGGGIVREKLSGSFIRLKTLPTHYGLALISKQITYLGVTMIQAAVIFAIGVWIFPSIGLPALDLPSDISGLVVVSLLCGWCAVSYAIGVGVFSRTQEQANGFGAASIVILAAIGGLMVPSFAMPGASASE